MTTTTTPPCRPKVHRRPLTVMVTSEVDAEDVIAELDAEALAELLDLVDDDRLRAAGLVRIRDLGDGSEDDWDYGYESPLDEHLRLIREHASRHGRAVRR